jgi:hypothetical protein
VSVLASARWSDLRTDDRFVTAVGRDQSRQYGKPLVQQEARLL